MKRFDPDKKLVHIAILAFLVLAAVFLFYEAVRNIEAIGRAVKTVIDVLSPFFAGVALAYILNPLLKLFDERLLPFLSRGKLKPKARRRLSILFTYLVAAVLVVVFIAIVLPQLRDSIQSLLQGTPMFFAFVEELFQRGVDLLQEFGLFSASEGTLLENLINMLSDRMTNVLAEGVQMFSGLIPQVFAAGARLTALIIDTFLCVVISIYLLSDKERMLALCRKVVAAVFPKRAADVLYGIALDSNRILGGFINGKIIDSIIIGILCYIGMRLLKLPYAMFISVVVGITNIIPYFGPIIGGVVGSVILVIINPAQGLWFALFVFALQQFDGLLLGPKILGNTIGLSAFWIIFGITLCSGLFGLPGMFIGTPLFAIAHSLLGRLIRFLLRRRGMPEDDEAYASEKNPLQ